MFEEILAGDCSGQKLDNLRHFVKEMIIPRRDVLREDWWVTTRLFKPFIVNRREN